MGTEELELACCVIIKGRWILYIDMKIGINMAPIYVYMCLFQIATSTNPHNYLYSIFSTYHVIKNVDTTD